MGVYLNPGAEMLRKARNSAIYVDKSMMLAYLNAVANTRQEFVCVSRPRRFGKSMAAEMVSAYYDRTVDAAKEFAGLAIAADPSFAEYAGRYDVVKLNMQEFLSSTRDVEAMLARVQRFVCREIERAYPELDLLDPGDLPQTMSDACSQMGRQFVVVIDEWDCPMREMQRDQASQRRYLDFLRLWLKDRPYVALCYMTGILPIKKYGTHSALNMFSEFSMVTPDEMAPYVGFTEAEVLSLCGQWGRDFGECRAWYDGYRLVGAMPAGAQEPPVFEAYAPRSVVRAMETGRFGSYWTQTETYDALRRYIDMDFGGLHDKVVELVAGGHVPVNVGTCENDMTTFASADDVLALLIHLGYLGFLGGEGTLGEAFVPNREVMGEFANATKDGGWGEVARAIRDSEGLLDALLAGDAKAVADGVERAHEDAASVLAYNDENSLACTLRLALHTATRRWRLVREAPAGRGFADLVMAPLASHPEVPGVVVELKYGATPEDALAQIREHGYARALGEPAPAAGVLLCGIAYDPKAKVHAALIERA